MIRQRTILIIYSCFLLFVLCGNVTKAEEKTYTDPNKSEKRVFTAKLNRIKAHSSRIPAGRRVNDMIQSLTKLLKYEINCGGKPAKKVVVKINSQFNHWDPNLATKELGPGTIGACFADHTYSGFIDNVKTVYLDFHIMLDPRFSVPDEADPSFGRLFDETLLYHEFLHGQLLINAIKNSANWKAKICNCTFDTAPIDPNHKTIYSWEQYYLQAIARGVTNIKIKRIPRQTAKDANGNFNIDLGKIDDLLPPEKESFNSKYRYPKGSNMVEHKDPNNPNNDIPRVDIVDGHLRLIGRLKNPRKPGFIVVRVDPPAYYVVFGIEESIVIEPAFGWTIIEDFESYDDFFNRIFDSWMDGWYEPTNGSIVGYSDPNFMSGEHFVETNIVHCGVQSMPFFYDNSVGISEATLMLSSHRDWTQKAVNTLSLWFIGKVGNSVEPMYVVLDESAVVYQDNPTAAAVTEWTEWKISLQEFANQGVDLTNVASFGIGFGNRENPQLGSSGLVFFDEIALFCSPQQ